jgi:hypothetical protein
LVSPLTIRRQDEEIVFTAEENGLLRDTHKFKLLSSDEITKLEKAAGSTPAVPQTTVPPSPRNKALNVFPFDYRSNLQKGKTRT